MPPGFGIASVQMTQNTLPELGVIRTNESQSSMCRTPFHLKQKEWAQAGLEGTVHRRALWLLPPPLPWLPWATHLAAPWLVTGMEAVYKVPWQQECGLYLRSPWWQEWKPCIVWTAQTLLHQCWSGYWLCSVSALQRQGPMPSPHPGTTPWGISWPFSGRFIILTSLCHILWWVFLLSRVMWFHWSHLDSPSWWFCLTVSYLTILTRLEKSLQTLD